MLPGMVFFHGGGWVAGSLETHDGFCRRLANESGCRLIAVDYRLAPDTLSAGLEDGFAAFVHIARNPKLFGIDPARLGDCGRLRRRRALRQRLPSGARDAGGARTSLSSF